VSQIGFQQRSATSGHLGVDAPFGLVASGLIIACGNADPHAPRWIPATSIALNAFVGTVPAKRCRVSPVGEKRRGRSAFHLLRRFTRAGLWPDGAQRHVVPSIACDRHCQGPRARGPGLPSRSECAQPDRPRRTPQSALSMHIYHVMNDERTMKHRDVGPSMREPATIGGEIVTGAATRMAQTHRIQAERADHRWRMYSWDTVP
jgi:hypothetical protein